MMDFIHSFRHNSQMNIRMEF